MGDLMAADNTRRNQYNSTPRKVFDKAIDRMELKRQRDKEDARSDLQVLTNQLKRMQLQLEELEDHVKSHCHVLNDVDDPVGDPVIRTDDTEEL